MRLPNRFAVLWIAGKGGRSLAPFLRLATCTGTDSLLRKLSRKWNYGRGNFRTFAENAAGEKLSPRGKQDITALKSSQKFLQTITGHGRGGGFRERRFRRKRRIAAWKIPEDVPPRTRGIHCKVINAGMNKLIPQFVAKKFRRNHYIILGGKGGGIVPKRNKSLSDLRASAYKFPILLFPGNREREFP